MTLPQLACSRICLWFSCIPVGFPNKPVMGWRDVVRMHDEQKEVTKKVEGKEVKEMKTWQFYELSNYKYITYNEFEERIQHASSGLVNLGMSKQTRFNIYAATA